MSGIGSKKESLLSGNEKLNFTEPSSGCSEGELGVVEQQVSRNIAMPMHPNKKNIFFIEIPPISHGEVRFRNILAAF